MKVKICNIIGSLLLGFSFFSCQQTMTSKKLDFQPMEFEEINHVNVNLINTEVKILASQKEINEVYKKINSNNLSPRKNPIPSYSEDETYLLIQPKIKQTDFVVTKILESNQELQIKIQQHDNPEFKGKKYPVSVLMVHKKIQQKKIELKQ